MDARFAIAACCSVAILGMFLPLYGGKFLAGLPVNISLTGAGIYRDAAKPAEAEVALAKLLAYSVRPIPMTTFLMFFAAAVGTPGRRIRIAIGLSRLVIVPLVPNVATRIALTAMRRLMPQLPASVGMIGPEVGGWTIMLSAQALMGLAFAEAAENNPA